MNWYQLGAKETLNSLGSTENGLSSKKAEKHLALFGPNKLVDEENPIEPGKNTPVSNRLRVFKRAAISARTVMVRYPRQASDAARDGAGQ
jgi:hypothetical protein